MFSELDESTEFLGFDIGLDQIFQHEDSSDGEFFGFDISLNQIFGTDDSGMDEFLGF